MDRWMGRQAGKRLLSLVLCWVVLCPLVRGKSFLGEYSYLPEQQQQSLVVVVVAILTVAIKRKLCKITTTASLPAYPPASSLTIDFSVS